MKLFQSILLFTGKLLSFLYPYKFNLKIYKLRYTLYSGWIMCNFRSCGSTSRFYPPKFHVYGGKSIVIGKDVHIGGFSSLTAFAKDKNDILIKIDDGAVFGPNCHITAASGIYIGKNLRTGSKILISDNSHGNPKDKTLLDIHPDKRPIFSKGPIYIGDNVWLGDNCAILGGVKIGNGVIVGANTIVTHDIPDYCLAVGSPTRIIKR